MTVHEARAGLAIGAGRVLRLAIAIGLAVCLTQSAPGSAQNDGQDDEAEVDPLALLWQQAADQPDDFALGCVPLTVETAAVVYNAETPFPLASISKVLIFMEYARRLEDGSITRDETVDVSVLDRYNLPATDRGAHDAFMEQYPAETQTLPLWDVAVGMIQYSSNAASDYLLDRLAPADWDGLFQTLQLGATDPPHAFTLIPLLMNNHETGRARLATVPDLSLADGEAYLDRYISETDWREREIAYRARRGSDFPDWRTQAAILQQHTATGTISDFLRVLRAIYGPDSPLSLTVRTLTRSVLRWNNNDFIAANYIEYGSKLGFYSGGTLTLIAYGHPVDGQPVISATFFRNLPRNVYRELVSTDAIGELAHWMNFNRCTGLSALLPGASQPIN